MVRLVVFIFSSLCVGFGWLFMDRGPMPIDITTDGILLYPMSSGSNDIAVLSFGLLLFVVGAMYAPISAVLSHGIQYLAYLYLGTLGLLLIVVFLVTMDSSLIFAARVGDVMPLISVTLAIIPVPVIALHLTRGSTGRSYRRAG